MVAPTKILIVGAIHESPVFVRDTRSFFAGCRGHPSFFSNVYSKINVLYVILSGGWRVRPPTEVEVLLRE